MVKIAHVHKEEVIPNPLARPSWSKELVLDSTHGHKEEVTPDPLTQPSWSKEVLDSTRTLVWTERYTLSRSVIGLGYCRNSLNLISGFCNSYPCNKG